MTAFHLKRNARKLAAYLPACYKPKSETTGTTAASDPDMSVEMVAMGDCPGNAETIAVEEDRDSELSESDMNSEGWSVVADEESVDGDWEISVFDNAPATDDIPDLLVAAESDPELACIAGLFPHWSDEEIRGFRWLSDTIRRLLISLDLADYRPGDQSKALWWLCHMEDMDAPALTAHITKVMADVGPKWQPKVKAGETLLCDGGASQLQLRAAL